MQIFYFPDQKLDIKGYPVATIGTFDGIHLGHQEIIKKTVAEAKKRCEPSLLITFDQHPKAFLQPEQAPELLTTLEQKINLLKPFSLDYLLILHFEKIANLTAEQFCQQILTQQVKVCHLYVGENFRFGANAQGTPATLAACGKKTGFTVTVVPLKKVNSIPISSSLIRQLLRKGEVKKIKDYLGRFHQLSGTVVQGDKRGKKLGFPTANIKTQPQLCRPRPGIYAAYTVINGKKYPSVVNCGYKPTFGKHPYQCETHIFHFNQDLYGQEIAIELLQFIRPEQKFSSQESLVAQIKKDAKQAQAYFSQ